MRRKNFLAIAAAAATAPLFVVLSATADLGQMNDGAPLVVIKSSGGQGQITVRNGEPGGLVRIPGSPPGVRMDRFYVTHSTGVTVLPPACRSVPAFRGRRVVCLQQRPINVPNLREGPHGVAITNPGGDLAVGVPNRVEGMFIQANTNPVLVEQTRGPYIIVGDNDVTLHGVAGNGWVRTTAGTVSVRNPGGALHIETGSGRIAVQSGPALGSAEIHSQQGDIEWTINGIGQGPYRIVSGSGLVRILVRPGIALNLVAASTGGTVANYLDPGVADVISSNPHAVQLAIGGGGSQVVVQSQSGTVVIAQAPL